jgi:hypothetical protein
LIEPVLEREAPESSPNVEPLQPGITVEAFGAALASDTVASHTLEPDVRGEASEEEPPEKLVSAEVVPLPVTPQ